MTFTIIYFTIGLLVTLIAKKFRANIGSDGIPLVIILLLWPVFVLALILMIVEVILNK